jgi:4-amino-4-deoxy-L-arabinose transferase-like glycosyltransferase
MSRRLRLGLALGAVTAFAAAGLLQPESGGHGLTALHRAGTQVVERVAFVTSNDGRQPGATLPVTWTGFVYQARRARVIFRVPLNVRASLAIDGALMFDTAQPQPGLQVETQLAAGFHRIQLVVSSVNDPGRYFNAGLEWLTPLGWRLVPAAYLYPEQPELALAQQAASRAQWAGGLAVLGLLCGLLLFADWAWQRRQAIGSPAGLRLAALILLALSLRLLFLRDVVSQSDADIYRVGTDHRSYQAFALDLLRGTWPTEPFYYGPGISLVLGAIYTCFGPHARAAQVIQLLGGGLACVPIVGFTRRVFGSGAGWAAGILWATFPLPIFYENYPLTHGLEAIAGAVVLWLWLRALDDDGWLALLGLGVALGAAGILRPNFLLLAPFAAASLAWRFRSDWRQWLGRPLVLAAIASLTVLPITWHNYQTSGRFLLISSEAPVTLYAANNLDDAGHGENTPAMRAGSFLVGLGKADYVGLTLAAIRADPLRWAQLEARKFALYWSGTEFPNNVDLAGDGTRISRVLAVLPLRYGLLVTLALAGGAIALRLRTRSDLGLAVVFIYVFVHMAVTLIFSILSRFRAPNFPALAILAGYSLAVTAAHGWRRRWRALAFCLGAIAVSGALVASLPFVADNVMKLPTLSALPPTARPAQIAVGDDLLIVGYEPFAAAQPGSVVTLTLYWQTRRPLPEDLAVTVQLLSPDSKKISQADHALGSGSFPSYPTSRWRIGQMVKDHYVFTIPSDALTPIALSALVVALERQSLERRGEARLGPLPLTRRESLALPPGAAPAGATIGTARLEAGQMEVSGGILAATLYWKAGQPPMAEDGVVFVHVFDSDGNFVAGQDGRPRDGQYSTLAWQAGEGIVDSHAIRLPPGLRPGIYRVDVGMYDAATQIRLPIWDESGQPVPDNVLTLGSFRVP